MLNRQPRKLERSLFSLDVAKETLAGLSVTHGYLSSVDWVSWFMGGSAGEGLALCCIYGGFKDTAL